MVNTVYKMHRLAIEATLVEAEEERMWVWLTGAVATSPSDDENLA